MVADLFVMLFLIAMVLFIVYHFYIDYKNWSNTGNTFAEGMTSAETPLITRKGNPKSWNPPWTGTSTRGGTKHLLGPGEGDCDNDAQCLPGLKCKQRKAFEKVLGHSGQGKKGWDYCYDPKFGKVAGETPLITRQGLTKSYNPPWNDTSTRGGTKQLLGPGEGDCDNDAQCLPGLKCKQRNAYEKVLGHSGKGKKGWDYCYDPNFRAQTHAPQRNFAQILQVNKQVQEQQIQNANNSGINLNQAAGINPRTKLPWQIPPRGNDMPKNIAEYVIGEIISGRLPPPPQGSPWENVLKTAAPQAYQRIGSANPLQQQSGAVNSQGKWNQIGRAMLAELLNKIRSGEMPPPPQGSDWENQLRTIGPIPPFKPHPSGRPAPTPQQVMMIYGMFTSQISRDLGQKIKRGELPPPPSGSFWDNKLKASGEIVNTAQNQQLNQQFDRQMAVSQMQSQAMQPGQSLQGVPSSQPAASKMQNTAIFNEQLMKQVLSNKLLIPSDIKLSQENQGNFIRVGKNFMKDLSHIRNVAIPNIDNDDYESLGRVVAKIKIQEKEKITGPQNIVAKQKLMNSVNNILAGSTISNSQVDWESPQHSTTLRTTGMYGDNSNSMIGGGDKASKPDGGLCMWKGCEKHPKRKPYDSVWSLY